MNTDLAAAGPGISETQTPDNRTIWALLVAAAAILWCVAMSASFVVLLDFFTPAERIHLSLWLALLGVLWLAAAAVPILLFQKRVTTVAIVYFMCLLFAASLLVSRPIPNQLTIVARVLSVASLLVLGAGLVCGLRRLRKQGKRSQRPRRTRRDTAILAILVLCVALAVIPLVIYQNQKDVATKRNLLSSANTHFQVLGSDVTQEDINATLMALERAHQELDAHLSPQYTSVAIKVRLFPSLDEYQQSLNDQSIGTTNCSEGVPEISLPVQQPRDALPGQPASLTPKHEMVHAIICGMAGPSSIPRWFHEGLAEYESLKGMDWLVARTSLRLYLWGERESILTEDALVSYSANGSTRELQELYYATSFEFMRYIVRSLKGRSPWGIVTGVSDGRSFDSCFEDATGHNFEGLYSQWLLAFRG
jgi:hypothetical protein